MGGLPGRAGGGVVAVVLGPVERAGSGTGRAMEMGANWDSNGECFSGVCDGGAGDCKESSERGEGGDSGEWSAVGAVGMFEHCVDVHCGVQCDEAE